MQTKPFRFGNTCWIWAPQLCFHQKNKIVNELRKTFAFKKLLAKSVSETIVGSHLRLLLSTILRSHPDAVFHFGLVCSTWVAISRGSTYRHYFMPLGDTTAKSVELGNLLAARRVWAVSSGYHPFFKKLKSIVVDWWVFGLKMQRRTFLAIVLIIARGGVFALEQPGSSLVFRHPRFQYLLSLTTVARFLIYNFNVEYMHSFP